MNSAAQLYGILSGDAGVAALVGDRIYKLVAPDGATMPLIVYRRSETDYTTTLDGQPVAGRVSYECVCAAGNNSQAEAVGDAIEACAATQANAESADGFTLRNRVDDYDPETDIYAAVVTVDVFET